MMSVFQNFEFYQTFNVNPLSAKGAPFLPMTWTLKKSACNRYVHV